MRGLHGFEFEFERVDYIAGPHRDAGAAVWRHLDVVGLLELEFEFVNAMMATVLRFEFIAVLLFAGEHISQTTSIRPDGEVIVS